jgi:hypothetical protein
MSLLFLQIFRPKDKARELSGAALLAQTSLLTAKASFHVVFFQAIRFHI